MHRARARQRLLRQRLAVEFAIALATKRSSTRTRCSPPTSRQARRWASPAFGRQGARELRDRWLMNGVASSASAAYLRHAYSGRSPRAAALLGDR